MPYGRTSVIIIATAWTISAAGTSKVAVTSERQKCGALLDMVGSILQIPILQIKGTLQE